jgi:hypothetical protein
VWSLCRSVSRFPLSGGKMLACGEEFLGSGRSARRVRCLCHAL